MVLQIMSSNYHAHLEHFGMTSGVEFDIKKLCKSLVFKYVFDFATGPLLVIVIVLESGQGTFWIPCIYHDKPKSFFSS